MIPDRTRSTDSSAAGGVPASRWADELRRVRWALHHLEGIQTGRGGGFERELRPLLLRDYPQDGWCSSTDWSALWREGRRRVWLVDAGEGPVGRLSDSARSVVSVALLEDDRPVLAVVRHRRTREWFEATADGPARLNGVRIRCRQGGRAVRRLVHLPPGRRPAWGPQLDHWEVRSQAGVCYDMAAVAAGRAQAAVSLTPEHEWSIAAGVLLVQRAGGRVTDLSGQPHRFNQPGTLVNGLVAAASSCFDVVTDQIGLVCSRTPRGDRLETALC